MTSRIAQFGESLAGVHPAEGIARVAVAVLAIVMGIALLYGAGFAQPQTFHDAAHDSRHALSFPCH